MQLRQKKKYGGSLLLRYDYRKMEVEEGDLRTPFLLKEGTVTAGIDLAFSFERNGCAAVGSRRKIYEPDRT